MLEMLFEGIDLINLLKIVLSLIIGGLYGFERKKRNKQTGIVTHSLVALGATLLTIVQLRIVAQGLAINEAAGYALIGVDPARIIAQIVSGVGFIGAGVILKTQGHITGITTAATLWVTAIMGVLVGYGMFGLAILSTALSLTIIFVLKSHDRYRDVIKPK